MIELSTQTCIPCRKGDPPVQEKVIQDYLKQIPEWQVMEREGIQQLERVYRFKNFAQALEFTNKVGEMAEAEDHHPSLRTEWGKVTVTWWTHAIQGLHQNDFILAARSDLLYEEQQQTSNP
jgi:4a-hydroxytetrahydrobiopterin dehydratase